MAARSLLHLSRSLCSKRRRRKRPTTWKRRCMRVCICLYVCDGARVLVCVCRWLRSWSLGREEGLRHGGGGSISSKELTFFFCLGWFDYGAGAKAVAGVSEELPFFILFLFYFSGAIMGLGPKPTAAGVSQLKNSICFLFFPRWMQSWGWGRSPRLQRGCHSWRIQLPWRGRMRQKKKKLKRILYSDFYIVNVLWHWLLRILFFL